jgi:hypothetical protein
MSGLFSADDVADLLGDGGALVILRRIGTPNIDVCCQAVIMDVTDQVAPGGVAQFHRRVTIGTTEIASAAWPAPPRRGDQIIAGGRTMTVQDVLPASVGCETLLYRLDTLGG